MKEGERIGALRINNAAFIASIWNTKTGDYFYRYRGVHPRLQLIKDKA